MPCRQFVACTTAGVGSADPDRWRYTMAVGLEHTVGSAAASVGGRLSWIVSTRRSSGHSRKTGAYYGNCEEGGDHLIPDPQMQVIL
jgi:hypothetical protein